MKYFFFLFFLCELSTTAEAQSPDFHRQVDSVLNLMTLDEKIGQLNQLSGKEEATGPLSGGSNLLTDIRTGKVGSLLNARGAKRTRELQMLAMESRLKIPLLFGLDVIHGYRTTLPIPLAESCSWDLRLMEQSARLAAIQAASSGIHWTFAPMVDISRDPRWGRVMEAAGEDPYLGSEIAKARVKGFQGKGLGHTDAVMACAKSFAAYGAPVGGRDYGSVDMSDRTLWQVYLPPFKAALDAGAATFMNGLNDLNGIPVTGNQYLQRDILKGRWSFKGFIVSDWGSVREMIAHGYAKDNYDAAAKAISAGCDMDMEGKCYAGDLAQAVKDGKVPVELINDAVSRILYKKFEMGLFDDPYRYCDEKRESQTFNDPQNKAIARDVARKSIVLLKNERDILPLSNTVKTIALIGPLANSKKDMSGSWNVRWPEDNAVTVYDGLTKRLGDKVKVSYEKGCDVSDTSRAGFKSALSMARQSDIIIVSVGETKEMSGEAKSRSDITIPDVQEELVKQLCASGKPVIVLISAGRPLVFNWIADNVPVVLYTWWLGDEAGNAIADVLFGDYNPSAKLTMTFPASVGQIPVFYNYYSTGRPASTVKGSNNNYRTGYIDLDFNPKYPFGYGLSYTSFKYSNLSLSDTSFKNDQSINVSFRLTNTGHRFGEEIVQLYIRDKVASVVQPVKALKGFQKVKLGPGESTQVNFKIDRAALSIYNQNLEEVVEPGDFDIMIGASSADIRLQSKIHVIL